MKRSILLSLFACATLFALATSSWAGGFEKGEYQRTHPQPRAPVHSALGCNGYLDMSGNTNLHKTMPSDVCVVSTSSVISHQCDENGNTTQVRRPEWGCINFTNNNTKFRAVNGVQGDPRGLSKIFLVAVKTTNGWGARHELWATGKDNAVTWMSGQASSHFAANGGDPEKVFADGNTPSSQPAPVQQAKADCRRLGLPERIACEAANNAGLGAAIGAGVRALGK